MNQDVPIDRAGRIVLPKAIRQRFRLSAGDTLSIVLKPDAIELKPTRGEAPLKKVNGVLVLTTRGKRSTSEGDLVAKSREDRLDEIAHPNRH